MSLTLDQLRAKVEPLYPEVRQVSDTVLRYIRTSDKSAFAVCYLDVGDDLPQTSDHLHEYLDHVVGEHYFEGASSLQWNSYLYFIRSPDQLKNTAAQLAKEFVEKDRMYARKYVISEPELDAVLRPKTLQEEDPDKTPDAISQWISILQKVNLVEAVLGDHTLPERMRLIERPTSDSSASKLPTITPSGTLLPPIRQFKIKKFRRCLISGVFNFSDVNLLFGANGTGKTSLLEAIELLYCGKTRRNPRVSEHYRFQVSENGKVRSVSHNRELQPLRDCNLAWYGVREQRSTNLYDGFGRFNFLNTDAAIELSQSSNNIDDDLAKLLVGSDAAKTWQVMVKLEERVWTELRGLKSLHLQVRKELDILNKQIEEIGSARKESDSIRSALHETLRRNYWAIDDDLESETFELIAELAELKAAAEQVGDLSWLETPVTLEIIESYGKAVYSILQGCASYVKNLKTLRVSQQKLAEAVRCDQEAINLIDELKRLFESGVEQRMSEMTKQREIIAKYSNISVGVDEETLRIVAEVNYDLAVGDYQESAVTARKHAEVALLDAKREYDDFVKDRDRSLSLAQELRSIAARILEDRPADECPLCHTRFQRGELAHHMATGVDKELEERVQKLLENVRQKNAAVSNTVATEKAANQIGSLCERMKLPLRTVLKTAIESLNEVKVAQKEARKRVELLASEIDALENQGLSLSRLNEVSARLNVLGIKFYDRSQTKIDSFRSEAEQRLSISRRQMEVNAQEEVQINEFVSQAVRSVWPTEDDPVSVMAELNDRLVATRAVFTALKRFLPRFMWQSSRPIVEWTVETDAVRGVAAQLQAALEKERLAAKTRTDASRRRDGLQQQDKTLAYRVNRLDQAHKALTEIQTKHSLKAMTKSALLANRRSIETIFAQIHSPAEFKAIGQNWTLVRKLDDAETTLTRVSTGQRAAFALAVFLSQNAQLRAGPRVILIDDPIAHVDDLNCLSFLDYLREIALTGTRQVFFATASDKLASLFERKFDFLGRRFNRFNLTGAAEE